MAKHRKHKGKGHRKHKGHKKHKRKAKTGGRSFRGKISYTPCRDSAGKFRSKPTCSR